MMTVVGFYESITNGMTYAEVNGVVDQSMTQDGTFRFLTPGNWQIVAAYAMGANLSAARINSPSLRAICIPEFYPGNDSAVVPSLDGPQLWEQRGPVLKTAEQFWMEISRAGADAQPVWGAIWLQDQFTPAPSGPVYSIAATATVTLTQGTWVLSAMTWTQTLPAGRYAVVGLQAVCNDCVIARLVYPGVSNFRPGVLVQDGYGDLPWNQMFRMGRLGHMGEFDSWAMPQLEFLGEAAGAESPYLILDVVKIR